MGTKNTSDNRHKRYEAEAQNRARMRNQAKAEDLKTGVKNIRNISTRSARNNDFNNPRNTISKSTGSNRHLRYEGESENRGRNKAATRTTSRTDNRYSGRTTTRTDTSSKKISSAPRRKSTIKLTPLGKLIIAVVTLTIIIVGCNAVRSHKKDNSTSTGSSSGIITPEASTQNNNVENKNDKDKNHNKEDNKIVVNNFTALNEDWVTVNYLTPNEYSRPGDALKHVNSVVVHFVDNPGTTAKQNRSYFENLATTHETKASSHFVVGLDGEVIQCIPLNEISYASNNRNNDTISIEVCHPDDTGKFKPETYQSLIRLVNKLITMYKISDKDDSIIRHYDVTGKICPKYYVENPDAWEQLKKDAINYGK